MRNKTLCSLMAAGLFAGVAGGACGTDIFYPVSTTEDFTATLAGANEVPPVTTGASGTVLFSIAYDTMFSYRIDVAAIDSPTVVRIFSGAAGVGGGDTLAVLFTGPATCSAGTVTSPSCRAGFTGTLNPAQLKPRQFSKIPLSYGADTLARYDSLISLMRNGNVYVNVHNRANPTGHVRGQILPM